MLQPLDKTRELNAVLRYLSGRLAMQDALSQLDKDPVWLFLKSSPLGKQASQEWTLAQLLKYQVVIEGASFRPKSAVSPRQPAPKRDPSSPSPSQKAPSAPTNVSVFSERDIPSIHYIADAFTELSDGTLLSSARGYSNQFNRAIYRWAYLRTYLIVINNAKTKVPVVAGFPSGKDSFVPDVSRDMLERLTFPQIVQLINAEPVRESELDPLLKEQSSVIISSVGVSVTAIRAASLVEMALVLMALYFWLYYREAKKSDSFPAPATLFSVFAGTTLSRTVFSILLLIPPVAAAFLAEKSFWITPANVVPAILVVIISYMIAREGPPRAKV
jgi:hypothetical protein